MIVNDSDIESIAVDPAKNDPPLLVDTDAVEPLEAPAQSFKVVARWDAQIVQVRGPVDELQLAKGAAPQVCRNTPGLFWLGIAVMLLTVAAVVVHVLTR